MDTKKQVREDLTEVFGLWLDSQQAQVAAEDVRAAEQMLESYPAPLPADRTLDQIKLQMSIRSLQHRRIRRIVRGIAAAAVIMIVVGLSIYNHQRSTGRIGFASLIPAALWETDDITSDDVELAYFTSEVDHLEAQIQAVENGDADTNGSGVLNEMEMELLQIDTDFWKG